MIRNKNSKKIDKLTSGIDAIPTLPAIVGRVMEIIDDPESSAQDLMEVVNTDQAIASKILKIANSAFYGLVRKVGSLYHAVMVLGFDEVRNLVVSMTAFNSFRDLQSDGSFDFRRLWEHSFMCGLAARIIAGNMKISGGELFVAGLLHDIGKPAICMILPEAFDEVVKATGPQQMRTADAEKRILGTTHADVGKILVKKWMMPENIVDAVGFHHQPAKASDRSGFPIVVHLADLLAHLSSVTEYALDDQMKTELFARKTVKLAKSYNINWEKDTVIEHLNTLKAQKEAQSDILSVLFT
ncbi:MAG: HDOD domain-containing protein [Desulfobacteraceae bacterium]|nr:HDOD domain-containing protein [Desulfobacteraceae bacterium]